MRILLIRPCCIGDVVMATATLSALRSAYPDAHITWAVGGWSRRAVEHHPAIDDFLDTGSADMPVKSLRGFWRFVQQMRAGNFDAVVSALALDEPRRSLVFRNGSESIATGVVLVIRFATKLTPNRQSMKPKFIWMWSGN